MILAAVQEKGVWKNEEPTANPSRKREEGRKSGPSHKREGLGWAFQCLVAAASALPTSALVAFTIISTPCALGWT